MNKFFTLSFIPLPDADNMPRLGEVRRKKLLEDIKQLLKTDPSVIIERSLTDCLHTCTVPVTMLLPNGRELNLILLAQREPVNVRVQHGQENLLSMEELASLERPEHCNSLLQTVTWIKDALYEKYCFQLRQVFAFYLYMHLPEA